MKEQTTSPTTEVHFLLAGTERRLFVRWLQARKRQLLHAARMELCTEEEQVAFVAQAVEYSGLLDQLAVPPLRTHISPECCSDDYPRDGKVAAL